MVTFRMTLIAVRKSFEYDSTMKFASTGTVLANLEHFFVETHFKTQFIN